MSYYCASASCSSFVAMIFVAASRAVVFAVTAVVDAAVVRFT